LIPDDYGKLTPSTHTHPPFMIKLTRSKKVKQTENNLEMYGSENYLPLVSVEVF
jgi:hypothetical protein